MLYTYIFQFAKDIATDECHLKEIVLRLDHGTVKVQFRGQNLVNTVPESGSKINAKALTGKRLYPAILTSSASTNVEVICLN